MADGVHGLGWPLVKSQIQIDIILGHLLMILMLHAARPLFRYLAILLLFLAFYLFKNVLREVIQRRLIVLFVGFI